MVSSSSPEQGLTKVFLSISDLVAYARSVPDTISGMKLVTPIEQPHFDDADGAGGEEAVEDEDMEADCTTAFLLQDAFRALETKYRLLVCPLKHGRDSDELRSFARYIKEHTCQDSEAAKRSNPEHFRQLARALSFLALGAFLGCMSFRI